MKTLSDYLVAKRKAYEAALAPLRTEYEARLAVLDAEYDRQWKSLRDALDALEDTYWSIRRPADEVFEAKRREIWEKTK